MVAIVEVLSRHKRHNTGWGRLSSA